MRKTCIILFCILCVYIITLQIIKGCIKQSFKKRVERLHSLDVSSDIIRDRLSGVGIYYINLNKEPERRRSIDKFIQQYGIDNVQRIEGVYGKDVKDSTYTFSDGRVLKIKNEYPSSDYSMAELGCFLSHVVAIKTAYENGDAYAIILEDDVDMNMVKVWDEGIMEIIRKAPDNWNIIQLVEHVAACETSGTRRPSFFKYAHAYISSTHLKKGDYVPRKSSCHLGTHAYLITRSAMFKFLESMTFLHTDTIHIKQINVPFPIDYYLYDFFKPDTVYMTNSKFIVNNLQHQTQIQKSSIFEKNFLGTSDEAQSYTQNTMLKALYPNLTK